MTAAAITVQVFDGTASRARHTVIELGPAGAILDGELLARDRLQRVTEPVGGTPWLFELADGYLIEATGADGERLAAALSYRRGRVGHWERSRRAVALAVPLLALAVYLLIEDGMPAVADRAARLVPLTTEAALGRQTLSLLDHGALASSVPVARQARLQARFAAMAEILAPATPITLDFRDIPGLYANAFALPGGTVVATDALVLRLNDDEVLAVLAHELGHVRNRHVVRLIFRSSGIAVLTAVVLGDASTLGGILLAAPAAVLQLGFSRDFESEADGVALAWLSRPGNDPCDFARGLAKIEAYDRAATHTTPLPGWLSSHPGTAERIARFSRSCRVAT